MHQCMMNLNFKLYRLAILRAYLFLDTFAVAISNIVNYNHNVKSLFQSALCNFNLVVAFSYVFFPSLTVFYTFFVASCSSCTVCMLLSLRVGSTFCRLKAFCAPRLLTKLKL